MTQPPCNTFVLCFDGTGDKFTGTDEDSNILKIYRMLDRKQANNFHYYQPGIGTYVTSNTLEHTGFARFKSWYDKAKDSAIGSAFADHVMGGYRFLMRYYSPGDDIYFFGFSRGAYTARFLAEMLDHVGLLSAGNEELTRFAWKTFSKWQARRGGNPDQEAAMYKYMTDFRETFSRPVRRIRFLGLFDTVNSVPKFEAAWMQRSKYPYTARSSAKVIRHAVSINERRAKFRQDLITNGQLEKQEHRLQSLRPYGTEFGSPHQQSSPKMFPQGHGNEIDVVQRPPLPVIGLPSGKEEQTFHDSKAVQDAQEPHSGLDAPAMTTSTEALAQPMNTKSTEDSQEAQRQDLDAPIVNADLAPESIAEPVMTNSMEDLHNRAASQSAMHPVNVNSSHQHPTLPHKSEQLRGYSTYRKSQDIEEVWFLGCHGDIGGGWAKAEGEKWQLSHTSLVWMVNEAESAGLKFDKIKMANLTCSPDMFDEYGEKDVDHDAKFHASLNESATESVIHDCLEIGGGLPLVPVLSWKMMEYLPFRRMDLKKDGSWVAIRWPLPGGEPRDIPDDAKIHNSVIKRMQQDPRYRPGNLIVGGGGRGVKTAPKKYGIGEWEPLDHEGDAVRGTYIRRPRREKENGKG